ncbi:uncharacterized protein [Choristoneura fumiferana]|uniref:uncharacterized protein n=1 Tax=Choristoneura fumiferana TaxID=7141 RepID=UPI003D15BAD9
MFPILQKYFSPFVRQKEGLSLLQIFKPLYFLLSVIGLFPSSIKFSSGNWGRTIVSKPTIINLACTLIMSVTICIFFCLHLLELSVASKNNSFTENKVTLINFITNMGLMLLVTIITYISAFTNRNLYINILNEMAACWADLPHSTRGVILGPLRIQVNCVVLGYLSLLLIVQLAVTSTETVTKYKMALIAMTFNLPEMIQFTQLAFYFIMMKMIIAIMKKIEENFAMIAHMRMVRRMGNDYVGLKIGSSLESLRRVRGVYARTLAVKRQVNAAFQGPLLFTLAQGYHSIICDAHILYHGIIFQDDFTIHDVNKIGRSLYDISAYINDDITQYKSSADLNDEITLHLEVVASAAVYLVILMQFDNSK